jgi:glycosyltransferase involved in cell wall biosynthesis
MILKSEDEIPTINNKLIVVIPAYNEQPLIGATVRGVIQQLKSLELANFDSEIIVVDDGSKDNTFHEAQQAGCTVLRHVINCGLGAAIRTGFQAALRRGGTVIITLDADGQHNPTDIKKVVAPILNNTAEVVIGSRLLNSNNMPLDRRLINWGANLITWLLFGFWTTDSQSGLRAFSRQAVEKIEIKTNRMEVSSELIAEISRLKLRFAEVPINTIYTTYSRDKGQSNINSFSVFLKLLLRKLR